MVDIVNSLSEMRLLYIQDSLANDLLRCRSGKSCIPVLFRSGADSVSKLRHRETVWKTHQCSTTRCYCQYRLFKPIILLHCSKVSTPDYSCILTLACSSSCWNITLQVMCFSTSSSLDGGFRCKAGSRLSASLRGKHKSPITAIIIIIIITSRSVTAHFIQVDLLGD